MSKETNYWAMKDEELKNMVEERKIDIDTGEGWNRKRAVELLQINDVQTGKSKDVLVEGDDGIEKVNPKHKLVKVRFHNTRENEAPSIFLGHNGKGFYIPREQDILIPQYLLDSCVKDAVEIHSETKRRGDGKIVRVPKKIPRFPYTIIND